MKVLVVGAGMYVTGRGETGIGTVLCSLAETSRSMPIDEVTVVARASENRLAVDEAAGRINRSLGTSLRVVYEQVGNGIPEDIAALCRRKRFRCAIVSVPDHLHFAYTRELLLQGVHCLVVKPLTPTIAEAKELVRIQKGKKLHAAVEFHKRFDETNLYVKKAIAEGLLGKLLYFTVDFSQRITVPTVVFRSWADRTNIFQYLGVHYADLVHFLTGFLPVQAMAVGTEGILKQEGIEMAVMAVPANSAQSAADTLESMPPDRNAPSGTSSARPSTAGFPSKSRVRPCVSMASMPRRF